MRRVQRALQEWFDMHAREFPWRRTRDPYRTLVAEMMLQQTQTSRVAPIYKRFLERFPSIESLARAQPAAVIKAWKGLGYNRRAVALHGAAKAIVERHHGMVPEDVATLRTLPGVGPYTASAVACFAFDAHVPVVDVNVGRVLSRICEGAEASEVGGRRVHALATSALPRSQAYVWNQALMDLGATVCTARAPKCSVCPVESLCAYRRSATRMPRPKRAQPPFAGSRRQVRGAVLDVLRERPRGASVAALASEVHARCGVETDSSFEELLDGLKKDGLVARRRGRVSLP